MIYKKNLSTSYTNTYASTYFNIYKYSIILSPVCILELLKKMNNITLPASLLSYHQPHLILQWYCKTDYCRSVGSHIIHDTGIHSSKHVPLNENRVASFWQQHPFALITKSYPHNHNT